MGWLVAGNVMRRLGMLCWRVPEGPITYWAAEVWNKGHKGLEKGLSITLLYEASDSGAGSPVLIPEKIWYPLEPSAARWTNVVMEGSSGGAVAKVTNISLLLGVLGNNCEYIYNFSWHLQQVHVSAHICKGSSSCYLQKKSTNVFHREVPFAVPYTIYLSSWVSCAGELIFEPAFWGEGTLQVRVIVTVICGCTGVPTGAIEVIYHLNTWVSASYHRLKRGWDSVLSTQREKLSSPKEVKMEMWQTICGQ